VNPPLLDYNDIFWLHQSLQLFAVITADRKTQLRTKFRLLCNHRLLIDNLIHVIVLTAALLMVARIVEGWTAFGSTVMFRALWHKEPARKGKHRYRVEHSEPCFSAQKKNPDLWTVSSQIGFWPIPISGFCSIHVGYTTDCNRVAINDTMKGYLLKSSL
jgi:hypothetical protein